ncbi:hypothetical protein JCM10213_005730 [Rhodosporidiobolus nylandii]
MSTPPPHASPAWTRQNNKSPAKSRPPHRRNPGSAGTGGGSPYTAPASSSSSLSLQSTTTSTEAPYLTHVHLHHGRPTLIAPDNLGARRQPGTVDSPAQLFDAGGGTGVTGVSVEEGSEGKGKRKVKKKREKEKERERREREMRERVVQSAVANAGRTPSPRLGAASESVPPQPGGMGRSHSGGSLQVPSTGSAQAEQRRRRSRERPRTAGDAPAVAAAVTTSPPPHLSSSPASSRPPRAPRPTAASSSSAAPPPRPSPSSAPQRPSQSQSAPPSAAAPDTQPPSSSTAAPQPAPLLPPLSFSSLSLSTSSSDLPTQSQTFTAAEADTHLDAHLSLGLLDPSHLLMSPPPAYVAPPRAGSPPVLSLGPAASAEPGPGPGAVPVAEAEGAAVGRRGTMSYATRPPPTPPPEPPSSSPSHSSVLSPPALPASSSASAHPHPHPHPHAAPERSGTMSYASRPPPTPPPLSPPGTPSQLAESSDSSDESESEDDSAEGDGEGGLSDPLVLAWEADRSAGVYSLDERIERDLARRRAAAAAASTAAEGEGEGEGEVERTVPSDTEAVDPAPKREDGAEQAEEEEEQDPDALVQLRQRILRAEQSNNSRGVVRALSVHATRSMSMRRSSRLPAVLPPASSSSSSTAGEGEEEAGRPVRVGDVREAARRARERALARLEGRVGAAAPPAVVVEEEETGEGEVGTRVAAVPLAPQQENSAVEEEDDDDDAPARPARAVSLAGHRLLAEAAERRMQRERERERERERAAQLAAAGSVVEEPAGEELREVEDPKEGDGRPERSETYARLFPSSSSPGIFGARPSPSSAAASPAPAAASPPASSKPRPPPPPPPRSRPSSISSPSSAPLAPSASTPTTRTPSLRRPAPPPPPNAREILAARRASLSASAIGVSPSPAPSPDVAASEPALLGRRRPLPIPPSAPSGSDGAPRVDAFTALRALRLSNPSLSAPASSSPSSGLPPTVATVVEHPGPPLPMRPQERRAAVQQEGLGLSMYTELDLLLARLEGRQEERELRGEGERAEGEGAEGGEEYDDLLLLSDVLGAAIPSGASATEMAEHLTVARVECERRRVTKSGKVKSKMSCVGVRCTDCAICLARFKVDQFAVVLPDFHRDCVTSWFRLSRVCPVCRKEVFPPRPPPSEDLLQ